MQKNKPTLSHLGKVLWIFTKYQIITKSLLAIIIYPIYTYIINLLIHNSGRIGISSGDYLSFIFSWNGLGMLIITIILLSLLVALDINTFIIMSSLIIEDKLKISTKDMITIGIKSIKKFFSPLGVLIMAYISVVFPLIGVGITIGPMSKFQIPNFISSVIFSTPLYLTLYMIVMLILTFISFRYIFTFHYILITGQNIKEAFNNSKNLTKKYWKNMLKEGIHMAFSKAFKIITLFIVTVIIIIIVLFTVEKNNENFRIVLLFFLLNFVEIVGFITFLFIPLIITKLTDFFYTFNKLEGNKIKSNIISKAIKIEDTSKVKLKTKLLLLIALGLITTFNLIFSAFVSINFDTIYRNYKNIEIVAHRGGGDLSAENTLDGIKQAIDKKAKWTEFDVQRTKDNKYIINHDKNFSRLSDESRASYEMNLEEIKKLKVKNHFDETKPAQEVATLEEIIKISKDKIGLFIELKGDTADEKMVDDVVAMIKKAGMEKEAILLSLDYKIITYIENKYPEMLSGYLYFFSVGQTEDFLGDYLVMEEEEATPEKIKTLKEKGKKVIVWTVNTDESIKKFVKYPVDGIITDHVEKLQQGIKDRDNRNDVEIIIDSLLE